MLGVRAGRFLSRLCILMKEERVDVKAALRLASMCLAESALGKQPPDNCFASMFCGDACLVTSDLLMEFLRTLGPTVALLILPWQRTQHACAAQLTHDMALLSAHLVSYFNFYARL